MTIFTRAANFPLSPAIRRRVESRIRSASANVGDRALIVTALLEELDAGRRDAGSHGRPRRHERASRDARRGTARAPRPRTASTENDHEPTGEPNMSDRTVTTERTSLITDADYDRLNHLAESPAYRGSQRTLIESLKQDLARRQVVPATKVPRSVVTMHSEVRVRDPGDAGEAAETYTLVYPDEADITEGRLSVLAPMGAALLGAREGETVRFQTPGGARRLKVVKIVYQPETAGDFHL
jgi:regulator of nucleoside diphosphate kinase